MQYYNTDYDCIDKNYRFIHAAKHGNVKLVQLLLEDPHVNPGADNNIAIIEAAGNGHTEIVQLLLEDGRADPGWSSNQALELAAKWNHIEVVKLLLADTRVNQDSASLNSIFTCVISIGLIDMTKLFLASGIIRQDTKEGALTYLLECIHDDVRCRNVEIVSAVLEGSEISSGWCRHLGNCVNMVRVMIEKSKPSDDLLTRSLTHSAYCDDFESIELLIEDGRADVNTHGDMAFRRAITLGKKTIVRKLFAHPKFQPNMNIGGMIANIQHADSVEVLLECLKLRFTIAIYSEYKILFSRHTRKLCKQHLWKYYSVIIIFLSENLTTDLIHLFME